MTIKYCLLENVTLVKVLEGNKVIHFDSILKLEGD